jgi:hypothetical protein
MSYKVSLLVLLLVALSGCLANAQGVVSGKNKQTARSAWTKAVSLANHRNAGKTCEADAYEWTILSELAVAVRLSSHLKNEIVKGKSSSAKALRKALAGNLTLFDLVEKMRTPEQIAQAMVGSVWYSKNGGVMGSHSILHVEKNKAHELVIDPEQYTRRPVVWIYRLDAKTGELTLSNDGITRRYKLEKVTLNHELSAYQLNSSDANEVGYSNEPDDCSA